MENRQGDFSPVRVTGWGISLLEIKDDSITVVQLNEADEKGNQGL